MRKWLRKKARYQMKKKGVTKINKDTRYGSYFSKHWCEYC